MVKFPYIHHSSFISENIESCESISAEKRTVPLWIALPQ
jgi:hypothetical protein